MECLGGCHQRSPSRKALKSLLLRKPTRNPYYNQGGNRTDDINLTRLRSLNPNLNANLFLRNLTAHPGCECGHPEETISHFLVDCTLYHEMCQEAIRAVGTERWNVNDILQGSSIRYNRNENKLIYDNALNFIASNNEVPRSAPASVVTTGCLPQWKPRTPKVLYLAKRSPLLHRIPMSVANPGTHCNRSRSST